MWVVHMSMSLGVNDFQGIYEYEYTNMLNWMLEIFCEVQQEEAWVHECNHVYTQTH